MVVSSITGGMRRVNPSADLDEETLTKIADQTGGRYFRAKDTAGLQEIYRLLDEMEPVAEPEAGFRPVKSLYYWPLGGAFVLALFLATMNLLAGLRLARAGRVKLNA
jgi:Ca-activated chloride channel family protein